MFFIKMFQYHMLLVGRDEIMMDLGRQDRPDDAGALAGEEAMAQLLRLAE